MLPCSARWPEANTDPVIPPPPPIPDSDIDIMVEINPDAHIGAWGLSGVILYIQDLFEYAVDVSERRALRTHVRPSAERDAVYAF